MNDVETKIDELSKKIEKIKRIVICTSTNVQSASDAMPVMRSISTAHQMGAEAQR